MKRRKRYNPRKHRAYSNTGIPMHILVKAATSKEPVSGEEIASITAPYAAAVEAIRTGTCTEAQFWHLIENHYLYIHLLGVLRGLDKYSDNPETDMLARLEIQTACEDALNKTTQIIDAIGERKKQRGRFIATGPELSHLTQSCEKFKAILGIANYSHYMQAFKNSEPVISDIAYRHNKRIKQEQGK
ncbi:hypothetical protein [Neisseria musculi]|uniref:Uncharacterized protein n=1 Tax=Neisseria musculi TaxID=1815583 RepID=A0A7H1M8E7_9NEIS|nr:hypothetical protein [Neisseria musculi]QNT57912.1 hypothetical protein H7A79_1649 [Neisseria musculi]